MTAAFLGGDTIGGQVPLLSDTYINLLQATTQAVSILTSQVTALLAAKQAIRIPAVTPFSSQLEANIGIQTNLTAILDTPATYFAGLVTAVQAVEAQLVAIPVPQFSADIVLQIANAAAIAELLQAVIDEIDEALAILNVIADALNGLMTVLNGFVTPNLVSYLTVAGVNSFIYQGNLNQFGGEADAVTPLSGFPGTSPVRMVFFFVSANDLAAVNAMNTIFKVVP